MFRAKWTAVLVAALGCAVPVLGQQPPSPGACPRVVTIQEGGRPPMQCRVLKTWAVGNGAAFEVEVLATGERITLVESGPLARHAGSGRVVQEVRSRIYHWAHNAPPPGAPTAPPDAIVPGMPAGVQLAKPSHMPSPYPVVMPASAAPTPSPAAVTPAAVAATPPAVVTPASALPPIATVTPVDRAPAVAVKPAEPAVSASAAQESDWRQSWGKAEGHKSTAPAAPSPPSQMPAKVQLPHASKEGPDPLADVEPFSPYHLKQHDVNMPTIQVTPGEGVAKEPAPSSDDDPLKLDEPKKDDVAGAEKKDPEPKVEPKKAELASKPAGEKPAEKKEAPAPAKAPPKKPESARLSDRFKGFLARKEKPKPAAPAPAEEQAAQGGMRSIYAACEAAGMPMPPPGMAPSLPAPPPLLDTDPSNAFTTVVKEAAKPKSSVPAEQANAFDGTRPTPPMQPYQVPPGMPPMPPRGYAGMPPMPPGVMPAYGHAPPPPGVMMAGYPNPGMVSGGYPNPNMVPAGYANPAMMAARPPMMERAPMPAPAAPAMPPVAEAQQLLLVLRSSLFPSNREWAADQLGNAGGNPVVVEMLLQSAKNDPAPTVREACVRNLGKMNASSPGVVEALTALQKDENEAVRNEVTRTLTKFQTASQPGSVRSPIQPASMR